MKTRTWSVRSTVALVCAMLAMTAVGLAQGTGPATPLCDRVPCNDSPVGCTPDVPPRDRPVICCVDLNKDGVYHCVPVIQDYFKCYTVVFVPPDQIQLITTYRWLNTTYGNSTNVVCTP